MYQKAKFLIFCMIFVAGGVFCQNISKVNLSTSGIYTPKPISPFNKNIDVRAYFHRANSRKQGQLIYNKPIVILKPLSCSVIKADFYTQNFGFFCKKELQLEKAAKIPLKFRVGSLQYNDYLEQKPNAVKPF